MPSFPNPLASINDSLINRYNSYHLWITMLKPQRALSLAFYVLSNKGSILYRNTNLKFQSIKRNRSRNSPRKIAIQLLIWIFQYPSIYHGKMCPLLLRIFILNILIPEGVRQVICSNICQCSLKQPETKRKA